MATLSMTKSGIMQSGNDIGSLTGLYKILMLKSDSPQALTEIDRSDLFLLCYYDATPVTHFYIGNITIVIESRI